MIRVRSQLIAIPLLLLTTACMTWGRQEAPGTVLSRAEMKPIRIARTDHSTIVLKDASVQNDSLIGTADDGSYARVAIPISEIRGVSEQRIDAPRSLALAGIIVLSALGAVVAALLISANASDTPLL